MRTRSRSCCFPGLSCVCQKNLHSDAHCNMKIAWMCACLCVSSSLRVVKLWVGDAAFDSITGVTSTLQAHRFLLCCHGDPAYNKRTCYSSLLEAISCVCLARHHMENCPQRPVRTHTHTYWGRLIMHTFLLQCSLHYCNTRDLSSCEFVWW